MKQLSEFADIHSHSLPADPAVADATVTSVEPGALLGPDRWYSVGIHPWHASEATEATLRRLEADAASPRVVAIGETGIDLTRGGDVALQTELFVRHAMLAEELAKPLIIHAVGSWNELIALRRRLNPAVEWVIHGFRGKPQLARQLVRAGFSLSLGEKFNPQSVAEIPSDRLYVETDESLLPIARLREAVMKAARSGNA